MPLAWGSISFNLLRADDLHAFEAVGEAAAVEFLQARQFGLAGGDDDFAADFIGYIVGVAKRHQLGAAADATLGFERPRPVVKPGMNHAAVVAGLMARQLRLLFRAAIAGCWDGPR